MKVGILTYHYALNYGAFLQALALQDTIKKEGHQVEFINYENSQVVFSYNLFWFKNYNKRKPILCIKRLCNEIRRYLVYPVFRRCIKENLIISLEKQSKEAPLLSNYDCIIIGSDQLWNKKITGGYDFFYSAQFPPIDGQKIVGYAISMNKPHLEELERNELRRIVSRFDKLSVRESTSVNLLQTLTTKKIELVIDPTFLLNKEEWCSLITPRKEKGYICVYPVLNQEQVKERAKIIAKELNKKIIVIEPIANSSMFTRDAKPNTPFEFLSYLANAELILTSSFHGTAFSLIFQKDFYILGDDKSNVRMKNFLSDLGIKDRIIPIDGEIDIHNHIDYGEVDKRLDTMIYKSKQFLKDSINS